MASMANPGTHFSCHKNYRRRSNIPSIPRINIYIVSQQKKNRMSHRPMKPLPIKAEEIILRSTEIAVLGAIFHLSKNQAGLALCPTTKNCVSTSENISDLDHYAPPWNYNPNERRGGKKPVSKEEAMEELLEVVNSPIQTNYDKDLYEAGHIMRPRLESIINYIKRKTMKTFNGPQSESGPMQIQSTKPDNFAPK
ncbi:hypothetical protein OROMI_033208 [Orobanche minor]